MKIAKTFRLSETAVEILDKQSNATEFVENLILSKPQAISHGESLILDRLEKMELFKLNAYEHSARTGEQVTVPPIIGLTVEPPTPVEKELLESLPTDTFEEFMQTYKLPGVRPPHKLYGYPCCHTKAPCKHWVYNPLSGEYTNELTNEVKSVI